MTSHGNYVLAHDDDGILIVTFTRSDVIDQVYIRKTGDEIYGLLKTMDPPHCIVDFERVRYLSSAALGMLVALHKVVTQRAGELRIVNIGPEVAGVFKLTNLPKLIKCLDNVEAAVGSIRDSVKKAERK